MGTGYNVPILRDDHAGACTALHIAAAKPGVGADHLLGGDGHNAGLYQRGNILNRQVGAVGAALGYRIRVGVTLDLLDHNLAAGQAGAAGNHSARQTTAKAKGYHTDAGRHTQQNLFAAVALFGLILRGLWVAGIAVAIVAAVIAVAAVAAIACNGALGVIAAVLLAGIIRIICLCGVGGVHSAAAHIGVTGLLCLGLFRLSARWLPVIILRAAIIIKTRIIIFTHEKSLLCSAARRLGAAGR